MQIECKAALVVKESGVIEGKAWDFAIPDRVNDEVRIGAFKSSKAPFPMLASHSEPIGVWESFKESKEGLILRGRMLIDDVAKAREYHKLASAGAITGLSVGMIIAKSTYKKDGGRLITEAELVETSLVAVPAHPRARITAIKSESAAAAIKLAEAIHRAAAALHA